MFGWIVMSNKDLIEEFKSYLRVERRYSKLTIEEYCYEIEKFNSFIKNKNFSIIKDSEIENYIKKNYSSLESTSINHKISALRSFFKYLINEFNYTNNPALKIELLKTQKKLPKYLTNNEIDSLLSLKIINKYDYRNKAMIELMYATGLRVSELINLEIKNIDLFKEIKKELFLLMMNVYII